MNAIEDVYLRGETESDRLDRNARAAGLPSGIGRLSNIDDRTLSELINGLGRTRFSNVLDIGCGYGFLGRLLRWQQRSVRYTGVERDHSAAEIASAMLPEQRIVAQDYYRFTSAQTYDAVFCIESLGDDGVDRALASRLQKWLSPRGTLFITLASIDGALPRNLARGIERLNAAGFDIERLATPRSVHETAGSIALATLSDPTIPLPFATLVRKTAMRTLSALRDGAFDYAILKGRRLT